jgi:hypothetical protein
MKIGLKKEAGCLESSFSFVVRYSVLMDETGMDYRESCGPVRMSGSVLSE